MAPVPTRRVKGCRPAITAALVVAIAVLTALLLTLTPAAGQERPTRIISLVPSTTEMLFAIGAGDRVVAVGSYDHFPPAVEKLPRVGALLDPNTERILSMRPDLVVLYGTQTDLEAALDRARIAYYGYQQKGLADITQTIRQLGTRVGNAAEAEALAGGIDRQLDEIRARTSKLEHPRTLLVFGREPGSLRNIDASGGDGFLHDMLAAAGGVDVLSDIHRQSVQMSTEMVLTRAPEIIIEVHAPSEAGARDSLAAWNTLASVPAVRNHRVYSLVGDEFVIPGPRVVAATERLAQALHPGLQR